MNCRVVRDQLGVFGGVLLKIGVAIRAAEVINLAVVNLHEI
jgi:hypothetical protein